MADQELDQLFHAVPIGPFVSALSSRSLGSPSSKDADRSDAQSRAKRRPETTGIVARCCAISIARTVHAGMLAAQAQFRRVKGYRQLPALLAALEAATADPPGTNHVPAAVTA